MCPEDVYTKIYRMCLGTTIQSSEARIQKKNIAYPSFSSAADAFERPAFRKISPDDQKRSRTEDTLDSAPVLVYTETEAHLGYSSTGYNNATISINQVSFQDCAVFM
jgi:hypothetical protein